jgi:NTE family protein
MIVTRSRAVALALLLGALALGGCATRPINPPLDHVDGRTGYRVETRPPRPTDDSTVIVLAFSGGGTRAAAFSYGVLEEFNRIEIDIPGGRSRLVDQVDVITGVSGGSFTALAYGLYGNRLFDDYERRFLKRDVQGELVARVLSPLDWPALVSDGFGRSELAAQLYDEILFDGATFGDLGRKEGPFILITATDISTGSRLGFVQADFDLICSDLDRFPLSRAAAASSAVPLVLSPVTLNNYGGHCGYRYASWARAIADSATTSRPAGRALKRYHEMQRFQDSANRPYLHLVDGGVSDNLGMRALLEVMESAEAGRRLRYLEGVKRIVVIVVNSVSQPVVDWDRSERPPSDVAILIKAAGVPIDRYSYEAVELLKDLIARWQTARAIRASSAFVGGGNPVLARASDVPDIDVFPIDVSFSADPDPAERAYLNNLPTSFVLPPEAVDRLRGAASRILWASPDFQRLMTQLHAAVIVPPRPPEAPAK